MKLMLWTLMAFGIGSGGFARAQAPIFQLWQPDAGYRNLLNQAGFENRPAGEASAWQAYQSGLHLVAEAGRNASRALACENPTPTNASGASQTLHLNRTDAAPIWVRGWSKAEDVSGSADSGYSLYVDIVYADGSPLWGQTASFRCGSHDWESRELFLVPEKPIRTLTVYCLFRDHTGRVWFDDIAVEEIKPGEDAVLFQGTPVRIASRRTSAPGMRGQGASTSAPSVPARAPDSMTIQTQDGLRLVINNTVASVQVDGRECVTAGGPDAAPVAGGFLVRDVAANSGFYPFTNGDCAPLHLRLHSEVTAHPDHITVSGRLTDVSGQDRAVMLLFALPVDATGWMWADDIRQTRRIEGRGEYAHTTTTHCGATGAMSLYPLAAIHNDTTGLALALDMAQPAHYRLVYHAGARQFFIAYDFGLAPETKQFPSAADFRFIIYHFAPRWGFRAAVAKLYRIFPDQFAVRSKDQGIWMPFTDISKVNGWQDFGFRYHEGNNNVRFDDAHGILSFRYTEPMTWWMPMKKEAPRTAAEALRVRDEMARANDGTRSRLAVVSQSAAMYDEDGKPALLFRDEPWCQGAVWSLNPNPALPNTPNGATVHWNEEIKKRLYGPAAESNLDGEYLDSLEGYVTADLNYRREHYAYSSVPLTFATDAKRPALYKGLAVFEFTKWFAAQVHALDKLTFANGVPYRFCFLCPWLDVMGTETDWAQAGKYQPVADSQLCLWRTMSGQKPYLLLMNTDFQAFSSEMVEKYFQRSLFYGMFPSMFSHNAADNPYWQNPKWYERDRPLFKKYLPLIKQIAEAGWQPVTAAACDNPRLRVERFGPDAHGVVYFTLFNDSSAVQNGVLTPEPAVLSRAHSSAIRELVFGRELRGSDGAWPVTLDPESAWLLRIE